MTDEIRSNVPNSNSVGKCFLIYDCCAIFYSRSRKNSKFNGLRIFTANFFFDNFPKGNHENFHEC